MTAIGPLPGVVAGGRLPPSRFRFGLSTMGVGPQWRMPHPAVHPLVWLTAGALFARHPLPVFIRLGTVNLLPWRGK